MNEYVHLFHLRKEIPFWGKFGPRIQNCLFKVGTYIKLNMQNSMVKFTFCVFDRKKKHFLAKLYQNIKIVGLSWNLVPRPIWLCRINGGIQFFHFLTEIPFWETLVQKLKTVILNWNLLPRLICICRIQWRCPLFLFWTGNTLFGQTRSESSKLSV